MTRERADRAREMASLYSGPSTQLQSGCEVMTIGEAVSFALAFADAEAAAMRERAAGVASDIQAQMKESMQQRGISSDTLVSIVSMVQVADTIATAIRALPATGEVGR